MEFAQVVIFIQIQKKKKKKINWDNRKKEFDSLINKIRKKKMRDLMY